jgi:FkbM family methyltransferase
MNSYAQHQEDTFILDYAQRKGITINPYVVEIGACDGIHLSNSRAFIELDFSATLIDPSPFYKDKLKHNYSHRSNVEVLDCAVDNYNGMSEFTFYEHSPDLSRLNGEGGVKNDVSVRKISDIVVNRQIGVMSIDTEGNEMRILQDMIDNNIRPQFLIIESNDHESRREHCIALFNYGYSLINVLDVNTVWIRL